MLELEGNCTRIAGFAANYWQSWTNSMVEANLVYCNPTITVFQGRLRSFILFVTMAVSIKTSSLVA